VSFFDEDDEPTRRAPRPRRAAPAGGLGVDPQTLWMRRAIALGVGALVLIVLVFGVRACRNSAHQDALRDYNREAATLVRQSDDDIGGQFFETMAQAASQSPEDLQQQISSLRSQADVLLRRARELDTPGDLAIAQDSLLIAFELRRDGLEYVAGQVTTALGDEGDVADEAIQNIAAQMQSFIASDVLIQTRVTPVVAQVFEEEDIRDDEVATRGFTRGLQWLDSAHVADQLGTRLSEGGQNRDPDEPTGPGLHGTGLTSVTVGDVTLQPGAANRVPAEGDLTFTVKFSNQGENNEFDVPVHVTLQGQGKAIRARKTVDQIAQGQEATVNLALPRRPTANELYEVTIEVKAVPGEEKTDNNRQTYNVLFTG